MRISDWSSDVCSSDLCWLKESREQTLDHRPACFETRLSALLSMRVVLCATKNLPHPEEADRAAARAGVSKDAQRGCNCRQVPRHVLSRSEEHTSELQSLMRISYAVFCLKKKNKKTRYSTRLEH